MSAIRPPCQPIAPAFYLERPAGMWLAGLHARPPIRPAARPRDAARHRDAVTRDAA